MKKMMSLTDKQLDLLLLLQLPGKDGTEMDYDDLLVLFKWKLAKLLLPVSAGQPAKVEITNQGRALLQSIRKLGELH